MTASETESEPRLLPRLTAFRWYAALVVCLYHFGQMVNWRPLSYFSIGTTGVSFFYVLSGFVLTWSFRADPSPVRFYRRRFARIYPATIVTGIVAFILVAFGMYDLRGGFLGAVTSILLLQAWFLGLSYPSFSYNSVAWSLSCEAFFYALLPLFVLVAAGRRNRTVVAALIGSALAGLVATTLLAYNGRGYSIAYTNPPARLPDVPSSASASVCSWCEVGVPGCRSSQPWPC